MDKRILKVLGRRSPTCSRRTNRKFMDVAEIPQYVKPKFSESRSADLRLCQELQTFIERHVGPLEAPSSSTASTYKGWHHGYATPSYGQLCKNFENKDTL